MCIGIQQVHQRPAKSCILQIKLHIFNVQIKNWTRKKHFKNIPKIEETAMVEWTKKAFQKLDAILGVKTLVILSGNLQICVRVGPVLDCREQMKP